MASYIPFYVTVTLTDANTNYRLSELLAAIDAQIPTRCMQLGLQFDSGAGADHLLIGNANLSASMFGRRLLATQAHDIGPFTNDTIHTDQIYLRSNGAAHTVQVMVVPR